MKNRKQSFIIFGAMLLFAGTLVCTAEQSQFLTRAQWLKKIGASVTDATVLRETLEQVAPEDRVEFTQRMMKAVSRLPVNPDEKSATFVKAAVACIANAGSEKKTAVIAEVFAGVPVEYLPMVSEELSKRFDRKYNNLTCEQYETIATNTLTAANARIAETDETSVRSTFVILTFLKGSACPGLQQSMMALLPDDRMRALAASWIPQVMNDNSYEAMMAAADAEAVQVQHASMLRIIGHATLDRLLADMTASLSVDERTPAVPLSSVRTVGSSHLNYPSTLNNFIDYGINRVPQFPFYPTGYQNQGLSVIAAPLKGTTWTICPCPCP